MNLDNEHLQKSWEEVQQAELAEIERRRKKANVVGSAKDNLVGLALSGGGIRSASFNLGVLQALVGAGLFRYVDFLSTVSGGGYIGAFLSSLAYRQHLDNAVKNQTGDYQPPPIQPNADGSQPDDTKALAKNSNFLNDKLDFVSRYLVGWFLNFCTLFSGLVVVSTAAALIWRILDMPVIVDLLLFFSNGFFLEWNRPFLPAALVFLLWVILWSWSYFMKGSVASARHSGKLLILSGVCFLVGCAIWLGTTNMNFTNILSPTYEPHAHVYFNAHQQWLWPLALAWLATILPFLRPFELLKSGTDTKSAWKAWLFHVAGYSLLIGIPFVTVYYVGRHNISGTGHEWKRDFVTSDITDWERFWKTIHNEQTKFKANPSPSTLTPGIILLYTMNKAAEADHKTKKFMYVIKDSQQMYDLQNKLNSEKSIYQYYTDINTKAVIADMVSKALVSPYYLNPPDNIGSGIKPEAERRPESDIFKAIEWLFEKPQLLGDSKITPAYRENVKKKINKITALPAKEEIKSLQVAIQLNRIVDLKEDAELQKESRRLNEIIDKYEFYHQKVDDLDANRKQTELAEEWMENIYKKSGAGHLLLRLYYHEYLRPIQIANRPTVIMDDQVTRCWILLFSSLVFLFFGAVVDFNSTSLHGFYRRRIQRVFLVRHANPDDQHEHREIALKDITNTDEGYPYHILSGCVEIDTGKRGDPTHKTAFQFTKHYCGGHEIDFCKTAAYRQAKMTLSSAAAISGAAVSPTRIQYLLLQIIMVVTNIRLGQWLPNPAKRRDLFMPRFVPFIRLLRKVFGGHTLDQSLLFVSDGGHYENLGIDVLLDRRCRLILGSDAGADPKFEYLDLSNLFTIARRKGIRFLPFHPAGAAENIEKEISLEAVQSKFHKGEHMAVWRIRYPDNDLPEGLCVYIKSSLPDPQPFSLGQYKLWHEDFPHDSTTNQFFHEHEFEAYRDLGYHLAQNMITLLKFEQDAQGDKQIDVNQLLKSGVFSK